MFTRYKTTAQGLGMLFFILGHGRISLNVLEGQRELKRNLEVETFPNPERCMYIHRSLNFHLVPSPVRMQRSNWNVSCLFQTSLPNFEKFEARETRDPWPPSEGTYKNHSIPPSLFLCRSHPSISLWFISQAKNKDHVSFLLSLASRLLSEFFQVPDLMQGGSSELTWFMFYAPLGNIRICEYTPATPLPLDDVTFGNSLM